ncbi:MAG: hypothetical protein KGI54_09690 [Pseudomonadota bacterium]|nr:hypothetical protein [Pseudomonadota bacterium]
MSPTVEEIRALYQGAGLKRTEAARLLGVPLETFISWLRPTTSKSHRDMPTTVYELFKIKIGALNKLQDRSRYSDRLKTLSITEARTKLAGILTSVVIERQPMAIDCRHGRAILVAEEDWLEIQQVFSNHRRQIQKVEI